MLAFLCPVGEGPRTRHATLKPPNHKHFEGVMGERERERLSLKSLVSVRLGAGTLRSQVTYRMSMVHSVTMSLPASTFTSSRGSPVPSTLSVVEVSVGQDVAGIINSARLLLWGSLGSSVRESPV